MELFKETILTKNDYINYDRINEVKTGVLFVDFIQSIIDRKSRRMSVNYGKNYKTLINLLNNFSIEFEAVLYTNSINEEFLEDFKYYLENRGLRKSYIKNMFQLIKAMIKKAANYGYIVDTSYDNVDIDSEEIPSVYLSMNEITRIYYFKGLTKKQEFIRDLFVVGCLTALRYSDLSTLTKENFSDRFIVKITQKTKTKVIIPIHDYVGEILNKYDGDLTTTLTCQHFNRYIKLICKKVGLNDKVTQMYTKGGKIVSEVREKWELISTHTGRRSGATNLYNTGRIPLRDIMSITGHSTEKSFMRYIKTSKEDVATHLAGDLYFKK